MNNVKQFFKKNWWVILGILIGGFFIIKSTTPITKETEEEVLEKEIPIAETITFGSWTPNGARAIIGTVTSESDIAITAELSGKINRVKVDMGDTVQAGQALATFDIRGDQTYVNYQNALNQLQTTKNSSKANIQAAKLAVQNAEKEYQQLLSQLEQSKKTNLASLRTTLISTGTMAINALNFFDGQIGASPEYKDHFALGRGQIGQTNQILKTKVQNDIRRQRLFYKNLHSKNIPDQEVPLLARADEYLRFIQQLKRIADDYNILVQGTTVTADFSNTLKQQIVQQTEVQNTQINQALTQLTAQINAVKNTDEQHKNQILTAQNRIESAKANLELSKTQSLGQIKSAQNGVNLAATQKADLIVRAPFSGKITEKNVRQGQFVSPGQKLFSMINLTKEKKVVAFLSSNELTRLKKQETVSIEYEGQTIEVVDFIEGLTINPQTQKIRVDFILPHDTEILPGKTVKILLSSKGISNLIPLSAISFEPNGKQEVLVIGKDGILKRQQVMIKNDLTDGILVTDGLKENDQIVQYKKRFYSGQKVRVNP